ncbi:MAG: hypothetical protein M1269_08235 [Chloroflexi bacterium]|nr:hypothetical protein [Chloroflexota bacterium]
MQNKKGYILVLTILVIVALFFFGFLYVSLYRTESGSAQHLEDSLIALSAAEAGVDDAVYEFKRDKTWTAGFNNKILPNSGAGYTITFNKTQTAVPYSTNNAGGTSAVTGYGGRTVPVGAIHIVSVGVYSKGKRIDEAMITTGPASLFNHAIFVATTISLSGNATIDSWNSANGTYNQTKQLTGGDIGTNSGGSHIVTLSGNATVYGNAQIGPGGTPSSISTSGNSSISGNTTYSTSPVSVPVYEAPAGSSLGNRSYSGNTTTTLPPGQYDSLSASGNTTVYLSNGVYVFNNSVQFSGDSRLILQSGKATIYIKNNWDTSGNGIVNNTLNPSNLTIIGTSTSHTIRTSGNSLAYYGIYAPNADITLTGNSDLYGAIVGNSFTASGNASLHRDLSITANVGAGLSIITRW